MDYNREQKLSNVEKTADQLCIWW